LLSNESSPFTFEYVTTIIIDDIHYVKPLIMLMLFSGQARARHTWILPGQHFGDHYLDYSNDTTFVQLFPDCCTTFYSASACWLSHMKE